MKELAENELKGWNFPPFVGPCISSP
uniref:Uncharacterized protein n=1 Tax=Anguilla anguilla TaxID=7936 RepID=A0A0E9QWX6_ANGAN